MSRPATLADVLALIEATPLGDTPEAMREGFAARAGPQPEGEPVTLGPVEALAVGRGPTLMWLHGGGHVFGAPETHVAMAQRLADEGVRVVLPRRRLAPEHPWPAMLEDTLAALDAVPGPVALGGDSAGGHLALVAALRRPRAVRSLSLLSPNTDRTGLSETRGPGSATDAMNDDGGDAALGRMAMPDVAPDDPDASPLLGDLARLPPLHLEAAGGEVLLDDALMLARRAGVAGAAVSLHVTPGLMHLFPLWPDAIPEGARALARLGRFAARSYEAARSSAG